MHRTSMELFMASNPDSDASMAYQTSIRTLIRAELSMGLDEFREQVKETLRHLLLVDLPRLGLAQRSAENDAFKFVSVLPKAFASADNQHTVDTPGLAHRSAENDAINLVSLVPKSFASADSQQGLDTTTGSDALRETASRSPPTLPGTILELPPQSATPFPKVLRAHTSFSLASSERIAAAENRKRQTCGVCGTTINGDALFCQKCGTKREVPQFGKCSCGFPFDDESDFCRKCGRERIPIATPSNRNNVSTIVDMSMKKKKPKRHRSGKLFKQTEPELMQLTYLQRLTTHKYYECCSVTLILINAIYLGWETQYLAELYRDHANRNQALPDPPKVLLVFQTMFTIGFSVELGLRWLADGFVSFFHTSEVSWNVLDVFIVGLSILELFMDFVCLAAGCNSNSALDGISVFRMLRIVRIARVARVIRVTKFFRELRMMIYSILGCVKNLVWVLLVLLMTFYIFGVGFTSAVVGHLDNTSKWQDKSHDALIDYFGTVDKSLLSLFKSMSGGNDWDVYYTELERIGMPYTAFFLFFIIFSIFAVVNIVTGVFVESTMQSNTKDREVVVHEELLVKQEYLQCMASIFDEMDEDGKGTISYTEFDDKLQDERVIAYFNSLKLDVSDARILFQLLDFDHSGEISIDEFLDGCYKLSGESRTMDLKIMQYEVRFLSSNLQELRHDIETVELRIKSMHKLLKGKKLEIEPCLECVE